MSLANEIEFNQEGIIEGEKFYTFLHFNSDSDVFKTDKRSHYVFDNCDFFDSFEILNVEFFDHTNFVFQNCRFHENSQVSIVNIKLQILNFINCTFQKLLYINNVKCFKLIFTNVSVKELNCNFNKIEDLVITNNSESFISCFKFFGDEVNDFELNSEATIDTLEINDCINAEINANITNLNLSCDSVKSFRIGAEIFDEPKSIDNLSFTESNFSGNIYFENIICKELYVSKIASNQGLLSLTELEVEKSIFEDILISNFHFNIIKFKSELTFERCNLAEAKLFNVEWLPSKRLTPNFLSLNPPLFQRFNKRTFQFENEVFNDYDTRGLKYQRDAFRQLKAASISNGNNIDALGFYRNEMHLYFKELRLNGGQKWYDFTLIFLNRWSSDFGQNWVLPLFWLFVFNGIFYFLDQKPNLSCNISDWWNGFLMIINYMNPLRTFWSEITLVESGKAFLLSVLNAYLIYHFIKASRKFGKA